MTTSSETKSGKHVCIRKRLRGILGRCLRSLNRLLEKHNHLDKTGRRVISFRYQRARAQALEQFVRDWHELGYKIPSVHSIRSRHIQAAVRLWEQRSYAPGTLQTYWSYLATLVAWIGKSDMVQDPRSYLEQPERFHRNQAAKRDRSPRGVGIDPNDVIQQARQYDVHVAVQLALQSAFALRPEEAWKCRPHLADRGEIFLIHWGTKGGLPRSVPIETKSQRAVITMAQSLVPYRSGSMIPPGRSAKFWRRHYYWICEQVGLTKAQLGITPYALRHYKLNDLFFELTDERSPVQGGTGKSLTPEEERAARQVVSEYAGHNRTAVVSAYLGSPFGKFLRQPPTRPITNQASDDPESETDDNSPGGDR